MKIFLIVVTLLISSHSQAGLLLDVGGFYLSDDLMGSSSPTTTTSKNFYNLGLLFTIQKRFWGGWSYSGIGQTDSASGVTTTFNSQDTGPYIKWQFGRNQNYSVSGVFNILSRATYSNGTVIEKWEGTSYLLQFAYMPEVDEGLHIGGSVNYYGANYTKKSVSGVESSATNTKSSIFPMLNLTKEW